MSIENEEKRWREQTLKPVKDRFPERKPGFETSSGISLPDILTPASVNPDYEEKNQMVFSTLADEPQFLAQMAYSYLFACSILM